MSQQTASTTGSNGQSALHDLFALTDEQILEIEPEAQDVKLSSGPPATGEEPPRVAPRPESGRDSSANVPQQESPELNRGATQASPNAESTQPPAWLAAQMKDPWSGEEARDLWNGVQQARAEAAAYREVFAKPEDARAVAERARQLDDIDRAYFTGDTAQRSQLAAMMLREDPAAFREMVFAGLRALEQAGQGAEDKTVAAVFRPRAVSDSESLNQPASRPDQKTPPSEEGGYMASYAAFEKAANEELERSVGSAIERTLAQALPAAAGTGGAALGGRLSPAIRQDIEKALRGDRQLSEQVAQILSGRRLDEEARGQVVRLIGERAQQLLPSAAKRVINEWTHATLAAHRGMTARADAASTRREVAPASLPAGSSPSSGRDRGQEPNRGAASSDARRVDYRKLSDEQILDM